MGPHPGGFRRERRRARQELGRRAHGHVATLNDLKKNWWLIALLAGAIWQGSAVYVEFRAMQTEVQRLKQMVETIYYVPRAGGAR